MNWFGCAVKRWRPWIRIGTWRQMALGRALEAMDLNRSKASNEALLQQATESAALEKRALDYSNSP